MLQDRKERLVDGVLRVALVPEELLERYALQLKLYAAMVRRQLGLPVTEAVLYSFHLGEAVRVEL